MTQFRISSDRHSLPVVHHPFSLQTTSNQVSNRLIYEMVDGAPAHGAVAHLLPQTYKRYISEWLEEDTPSFDYGGFVVGEGISEAKLLGKSDVSGASACKIIV